MSKAKTIKDLEKSNFAESIWGLEMKDLLEVAESVKVPDGKRFSLLVSEETGQNLFPPTRSLELRMSGDPISRISVRRPEASYFEIEAEAIGEVKDTRNEKLAVDVLVTLAAQIGLAAQARIEAIDLARQEAEAAFRREREEELNTHLREALSDLLG